MGIGLQLRHAIANNASTRRLITAWVSKMDIRFRLPANRDWHQRESFDTAVTELRVDASAVGLCAGLAWQLTETDIKPGGAC